MELGSLVLPCKKCKAQQATLTHRAEAVCRDCFVKFISSRTNKQMLLLGKEIPPLTKDIRNSPPRRYMLGLSLESDVSSSFVLLHLLSEKVAHQLAAGRVPFDMVVVHVDLSSVTPSSPTTDRPPVEDDLQALRQRYPGFVFLHIPLSDALDLSEIDTSLFSSQPSDLGHVLTTLPSAASRSDIITLLIRRLLHATARRQKCQALLLGHSTTALAELTLSAAAKGRGHALPWLVADGPVLGEPRLIEWHPLRDLLRQELVTFAALAGLADGGEEREGGAPAAVVSHRDLSIEDVMSRYFAEVELNYPSVVANVAKTTAKLEAIGRGGEGREDGGRGTCALCGMPLDEDGDERWRGETGALETVKSRGDGEVKPKPMICYGCERALHG